MGVVRLIPMVVRVRGMFRAVDTGALLRQNAAVIFAAARFGRLLVVLALVASIGGHWALLQSVAWTQMLVERTQAASFGEAVKTTFDGAHPCAMCKRISDGKQKEQQPSQELSKVKLDVICERAVTAVFPPRVDGEFARIAMRGEVRAERPPLLPPRVA